jgi:hypothetical protein
MKRTIFLVLIIIAGCTPAEHAAPTADEIKNLAITQGETISSRAQKALSSQLKKTITERGPVAAVQFCSVAALPILDSVQTNFDVTIKRSSLWLRNPLDVPTEVEKRILEEYRTQLREGNTLEPVVKTVNDSQVLFAKPIMLDNPLCLNCHGQPGTQVTQDVQDILKTLYPTDQAINHSLGDLRGIWSITFEKDELIEYINNKL